MNEKISELAEQSGYQEGFRFSMEDFDMYKFAELIVRECIKAVKPDTEYPMESVSTMRIKEHFGVEE